MRRYPDCAVHLAFEASGFGYELAWWARENGIAVTVVAPSRMERAPGLQVKTDRLDVGRMARQLEEGSLKGIYVPDRGGHERRQVVRTYGQVIKERKRAQVRIRSLMQEHGRLGPAPSVGWKVYSEWLSTQELPEDVKLCVKPLQAMRTLAEHRAGVLEQRLHSMARGQDYRPIVTALCSQGGVGAFSAIRFILEIGDVHRFPTADRRVPEEGSGLVVACDVRELENDSPRCATDREDALVGENLFSDCTGNDLARERAVPVPLRIKEVLVIVRAIHANFPAPRFLILEAYDRALVGRLVASIGGELNYEQLDRVCADWVGTDTIATSKAAAQTRRKQPGIVTPAGRECLNLPPPVPQA